jgi:hypothetical protein
VRLRGTWRGASRGRRGGVRRARGRGRSNTRQRGPQSSRAVCGLGLRDLGRRGSVGDLDTESRLVGVLSCARTRAASRGGARSRARFGEQPSSQRTVDCLLLQNFDLGDIFSKYESCSVKCPLQLLQRAIGVLMIGLIENASRKSAFARLKTMFI